VAFVLFLLLTPNLGTSGYHFFENEDKVVHFGLFSVGAVLWMGHLIQNRQLNTGRAMAWIALFGIIFGGGTELLQGFIPGRGTDIRDFVVDTLGMAAGIIFQYFHQKRKKIRSN